MGISRRSFLVNAVRVAGGLALAGCAPAGPAGSSNAPAATAGGGVKRGGTLVYADWADATTLDPCFIRSQAGRRPGKAIFDSLVDIDGKGNIIPRLAESWDVPDAKTYVLHLRKGVKFHDGTAFDAEAVKLNMDRFVDPKVKSLHASELENLAGVDVVDAYTVKYRLKTPSAAFLPLVYDWNGFISSPAALQKWGDKDYGLHPVGAGPFKFVEHQDGVHTVIERNGDHWEKDRPHLDRIEFKPILNDATREVEVRSGTSHVADQMPFQNVEKLRAAKEIVLVEVPGAKIYLPYFQVEQSPYGRSLPFRQALNWLVDREAIWSSVFFKTGTIAFDPFIPGTPFADPSYKPFTHNVDKAKALLEQAYKDGVPSPAEFTMYTDEEPVSQKLCQIVQANYAEVGVKVTLQNEAQAARTARETKGDFVFSLNSLSWVGYRPDPAQFLARYWHSKSNYQKWPIKDAEIDRLVDSGAAETDLAKRKKLYRQLAERINQLAPTVFLAYGSDIKALSPKVKNFAPHPDQVVRFTDMWLE